MKKKYRISVLKKIPLLVFFYRMFPKLSITGEVVVGGILVGLLLNPPLLSRSVGILLGVFQEWFAISANKNTKTLLGHS